MEDGWPCDLYVLRHGRSLANEASLIVSSLENGVLPQYALALAGQEQARATGRLLAATLLKDADAPFAAESAEAEVTTTTTTVHFYASPFSRTVETAALAAEAFQQALEEKKEAAAARRTVRLAGAPRPEPALRERFFGATLELQNHAGYSPAWEGDARDPWSRPPGNGDGESVVEVAKRSAELLRRLAEQHGSGDVDDGAAARGAAKLVVVLVSHGDTLSILQTAASGGDLREHRKLGLETAELKKVGRLSLAAARAAEVAARTTTATATAGVVVAARR